jgi:hypothetical protein
MPAIMQFPTAVPEALNTLLSDTQTRPLEVEIQWHTPSESMEVPMGNDLKMADKQRIQALLELGWSYRKIERATGVRRETVARYDPRKQANAANPSPPQNRPKYVNNEIRVGVEMKSTKPDPPTGPTDKQEHQYIVHQITVQGTG